jgi:hypothetical protein
LREPLLGILEWSRTQGTLMDPANDSPPYKSRLFQYANVPRDSGQGHTKRLGQFRDHGGILSQFRKQSSPGAIAKSAKHMIELGL